MLRVTSPSPVAYSYVRFSSAQQAHGASLERQQSMIAAWLQDNPDHSLSDLRFEDLGVSGYKGAHLENAFGRLLAAVETGVIKPGDCILIEAIDRAGRLPPDKMLHLLTSITSAGVRLVSLDDGLVYDSSPSRSSNLFLLVAKCQQAWQYSDALSRRIKDAYQRKREKAKSGGGVARRTPLWLDENNELIPELAPLIRQAFEDYTAGIGERRILARIRGKHPLLETINPTTIKRWFNNKVAIGHWSNDHLRDKNGKLPARIPETEDIRNVYPAVVDEELFYRVQRRLKERYKPKSSSSLYVLSGLVVCGRCGANFGVLKHPHSPLSMVCMNRHRLGVEHGCTNSKSLPYPVLEFIRFSTCTASLQMAMQAQKLSTSEKRLITLDAEIAEQHRISERIVEAITGIGSMPALTAKLIGVQSTIAALEAERSVLKATEAPVTFNDAVWHADDLMDEDDSVKLNALLQSAGYKIVCNGTSITVDHPSLEDPSPSQTYEYVGASRKDNVYVLRHNGHTEHRLPIPNAREKAEYTAYLKQEGMHSL